MSAQARAVVGGEPAPVHGGGGKELDEFAAAYNRALADLAALRKRLAATERIAARREIARRVAHEIKNPLAPIQAAVETLRRLRARGDPAFDEYFEEATRTVLDEVARISHIVSQFTRFSRLPPPRPAPMDAVETARQVASLHAAGDAPVDFSASPVPPLVADRDQVVQVLTNLVQNAIDAIAGREGARVRVRVEPGEREHALFVVEDDGPGIPEEIRERLFEPYATTKPNGTGLGLAIAQRIAVEHAGELRHASPREGGTRFELWLPLAGPSLLPEPPTVTGL
jgi:two-component system, NtrC family, nitrogen regulation sensor histidine kinase NtrY